MSGSKYDSESINYALTQNLGRPRTVLDVGCGAGDNGRVARELGALVVGVESSRDRASLASEVLDEVISGDPAGEEVHEKLGARRFDTILFADAIGTAADPRRMLARYAEHLEDGGHVILALPHVANRDKQGNRYTRREALALVESAGLEVLRIDFNSLLRKPNPEREKPLVEVVGVPSHSRSPVYRAYKKFTRPMRDVVARAAPGTFSLQHVVVARKAPKPGPLSLTIGMLTYNEHESVEKMIDDIRAVAPDAEILCVDSSSDRTPELARAKGARVVRQLPPRGHGPAMEALMYEAARTTEALIYLDCDFTYPTSMIPRLRQILEAGADVVNGSRTHHYPKAMPVPNFLANRFFAASAQIAHGIPTTDVHSGMRAYRSSVIRAFDFDGEGDALPLDTLVLPAKSNYNVVEIPIEYNERVGFSKLAKLRGTVWTFLRIASEIGIGKRVTRRSRFRHLPG